MTVCSQRDDALVLFISLTQLQGALNGIDTGELTFGSHAQFIMGKMDFDNVPYVPAQLPRTGKVDLVSVAVHELAHGLGISNMVTDLQGRGTFTPAFDNGPFGSWTSHLRDDRGNPARPGQVILCHGCNNRWDPQSFDVRLDKGYFTGEHVNEVLAGTMPGVPVKMSGDDGSVDDNYMSHIELKNSMMSHQNYRNYTTFMEADHWRASSCCNVETTGGRRMAQLCHPLWRRLLATAPGRQCRVRRQQLWHGVRC
ncbi:hypothetical protein ACE2PP_004913 [Salmonella enterica]